jgi:hypothetical protein
MYAPEGRQFESWLEDIASDKALFETVKISEDDFVDFSRAVADAKERMAHLPRMTDGSPLIRKIKGMCEEVATEYDLKAEDIYSALSGEDVINEGEPRQYKGDGSDAMVSKDGEVIVIDADELEQYMADGWILAEDVVNEEEPFVTPKGYVPGEPKIITVNEVVPLAGDSIWMDEAPDGPVDEV